MKRIYYANQLVFEIPDSEFDQLVRSMCVGNYEFYNGAYIHTSNDSRPWYRCDGTPVLLEDVPKEILVLNLINP